MTEPHVLHYCRVTARHYDYRELLESVVELWFCSPEGQLWSKGSEYGQSFEAAEERFLRLIAEGCERAGYEVLRLERLPDTTRKVNYNPHGLM